MDSSHISSSMALFDVYLRLRPHSSSATERFLDVEDDTDDHPTHITIKPPASDQRKRAVERFSFTRVFQEDASQLDLLNGTELPSLVQGVLAPQKEHGRDGLLATLGVTGSGKSHTILGTKTQRGLTQMSLALLFKTLQSRIVDPDQPEVLEELAATDVSEAHLVSALDFLDSVYGGNDLKDRSRTQTPLKVSSLAAHRSMISTTWTSPLKALHKTLSPTKDGARPPQLEHTPYQPPKPRDLLLKSFVRAPKNIAETRRHDFQDVNVNTIYTSTMSLPKKAFPRVSNLPQNPRVDDIAIEADESAEYAIILSMFEVYNNGIFDLLTDPPANPRMANKERARRALLFKSTEFSHDRKVVAGLKKIVCAGFEEALLVLNAGLTERRVSGTKSNATSSRSHGFFCIEVKKRQNNSNWSSEWTGNTLTIADLAGSERADLAKTAGSTLAEAGKINESLMYLGQCMQMQSDSNGNEPSLVPYRSCKLTEILFTNDFQQPRNQPRRQNQQRQKAIMIVTADARGDFNATSQILRYSALAREVTVPRIPSVTSSIICSSLSSQIGRVSPSGNHASSVIASGQLEEITRLQTELQIMQLRLQEETSRRRAVEESLARVSIRNTETTDEVEARIRADCMDEAEQRLQSERERWANAADAERCKQEEYLDGKVGILSRATGLEEISIYDESDAERMSVLEDENAALREQVSGLQSELRRMRNADVAKTPSRRVKTLTSKRWVADDGENSTREDLS